MGNRMFERFPRGFYAPVYNRYDPTDFFGDRNYKRRIPGCTIDHYMARFANLAAVRPTDGGLNATIAMPKAAVSPVTYADDVGAAARIVSDYAIKVVEKVLSTTGVKAAVITSTLRLPSTQAEIMYRMSKQDIAAQYKMYKAAGDQVIDVYKDNKDKPKADVVKLMTEKIEALHAKGIRVSLHVSTVAQYEKLNVFDIGVNSTKAVAGKNIPIEKISAAFEKLKKEGYIHHFIDETKMKNSCWHLEIAPNAKAL